MTRIISAASFLLMASVAIAQQPAQRLKGVIKDETGAPLNEARIHFEAILGFRGNDQFAGQRTFTAKSDKNGEWSVLGLTPGVWLFVGEAYDKLPHAFALPVKMMKHEITASGALLPWTLEFALVAPTDSLAPFAAAVKPAFAGKKQDVLQILSPALESRDPRLLVAAGEILLIIKESINAEMIFNRAVVVDAQNWRVHMGLASARLMNSDWNAATKSLWTARDFAPAGYKQAISAGITDLQKILNVR